MVTRDFSYENEGMRFIGSPLESMETNLVFPREIFEELEHRAVGIECVRATLDLQLSNHQSLKVRDRFKADDGIDKLAEQVQIVPKLELDRPGRRQVKHTLAGFVRDYLLELALEQPAQSEETLRLFAIKAGIFGNTFKQGTTYSLRGAPLVSDYETYVEEWGQEERTRIALLADATQKRTIYVATTIEEHPPVGLEYLGGEIVLTDAEVERVKYEEQIKAATMLSRASVRIGTDMLMHLPGQLRARISNEAQLTTTPENPVISDFGGVLYDPMVSRVAPNTYRGFSVLGKITLK